ncbi:hypothetical protein DXA13_16040 [Clostridium sp. AM58-1XD]|nr:hypothetical protein DXA13_16040 [Clostridium sp. AM58-1XD]
MFCRNTALDGHVCRTLFSFPGKNLFLESVKALAIIFKRILTKEYEYDILNLENVFRKCFL